MIIQTSRFGQVEVGEDLITFVEGLLGFPDLKKFVLLDDPNDDIFAWLQSCEEPAIAFPVLEPELFQQPYDFNLSKTEMSSLKIANLQGTRVFCIVTIPEDATKMTANLKAPVVVNVAEKIARQCVLQDNNFAIREPIFAKLQQRVFQNPNQTIKSQSSGMEVAVKLPEKPTDHTL